MVSTGGALPKKKATRTGSVYGSTNYNGALPSPAGLKTVPSGLTAGLATPAAVVNAASQKLNPYLNAQYVASHPAPAASLSTGGGGGGGTGGGGGSTMPSDLAIQNSGLGAYQSASPSVQNQQAWDGETGYAKKYSPAMLDTILNQHPEILTQDVLKGLGIDSTAYAGQLSQDAGVGQLVAFIMQSLNGTDGSNANTVNDVGDYLRRRATPGGSTPDTQFLLNAILNSGPDSKIYQELGLGAASGAGGSGNGQANTNADSVNNMIYGAMNDQNKYTQQATKNYLADQQSNYIRQLATNPQASPANYLDYLKGSQLSNWFG